MVCKQMSSNFFLLSLLALVVVNCSLLNVLFATYKLDCFSRILTPKGKNSFPVNSLLVAESVAILRRVSSKYPNKLTWVVVSNIFY